MVKEPLGSRRRAREVVFRVAYQADIAGETYASSWDRRREEEGLDAGQTELVDDVVRVLERQGAELDQKLQGAAQHWPLDRLSATDRSVLRAALAELVGRPGTPARVVLDEAIDIAKRFGSEESGRFVNGILDRLARDLRPAEF